MTLSTDPLAAWQALPEPARVFADALAVWTPAGRLLGWADRRLAPA